MAQTTCPDYQSQIEKVEIPLDLKGDPRNFFAQAAMVLVSANDFPSAPPIEINKETALRLAYKALYYGLDELSVRIFEAFEAREAVKLDADPWAIVALQWLLAALRFGEVEQVDNPPKLDFGEIALQKAATTIITRQNSRAAATNSTGEGLPKGIIQRPGGVITRIGAVAVSRFDPDTDEKVARIAAEGMGIECNETLQVFPGEIGISRTNGTLPKIQVVVPDNHRVIIT